MNGNTHSFKRLITGFVLAAAVASLAVPSAFAGNSAKNRLTSESRSTEVSAPSNHRADRSWNDAVPSSRGTFAASLNQAMSSAIDARQSC